MNSPSEENAHQEGSEANYVPRKLVRSFFEKKFKYEKCPNWKLPPPNELFTESYDLHKLEDLKNRLNSVKGKLNDYPIEDWSAHTRRRNPAGDIAWRIKNIVKAEFVTQAWCKFYECLCTYPIVNCSQFNSVHLCEAPGAFIVALNHYFHSNFSVFQWDWMSSTLNPYYEGNALSYMVVDDRFMLHTLDKWNFGEDFTGNIIDAANIEHLARVADENLGEIHLVTADGSIDCMENPDFQEEVVFKLHYAEICAALRILSDGGSFVLKMFTMFETTTVSLMYLLNCLFDQVHVFKPATSKCGNSEVYVVCLRYRKDTLDIPDFFSVLYKQLNSTDIFPIIPRKYLPENFLKLHELCAKIFTQYQINVIESNIRHYEHSTSLDIKRCKFLRVHVCNFYLKRFKIHAIPEECKILYNRKATVQYEFHPRIYTGSFSKRSSIDSMTVEEKFMVFKQRLSEITEYILWPYPSNSVTLHSETETTEIMVYEGKPITEVLSSLFVYLHLMHLRNKIIGILPKECEQLKCTYNCFIYNSINGISKHIICKDEINEKLFFQSLVSAIIELEADSLYFQETLFLTHFSMSVIHYLWSNIFQEIIVDAGHSITLKGRKKNSVDELKKLRLLFNSISFKKILCIVDIKHLHKNDFGNAISYYNNELLLTICKDILGD